MGDYEEVFVNLSKSEQYTEWYLKINPLGKAPALKHEREGRPDFDMFESHAILAYLCKVRGFD